jgi:hypothetical protein
MTPPSTICLDISARSSKRLYSGDGSQGLYTLSINDKIINSEEVLMKWLNAHEYHRDSDKQKQLAELYSMLSPEVPKAIFVWLLHSKAKAILFVAFMILRMVEDDGSVTIDLSR